LGKEKICDVRIVINGGGTERIGNLVIQSVFLEDGRISVNRV